MPVILFAIFFISFINSALTFPVT